MASKISVIIDVAVDKANTALGGFRKSVAEADTATGKFKAGAASAFASLQANAGVAAMAAGGALVAFGAKAVDAASDLEESTNAVNKSFGRAAEGVLEIGEGAAKSFGLSQAAFNAAAVSFASFAQTVAGPGGDVATVIEDLTTRAADFASVMNIDVAEASTVFRSGLSGETEPLKKFGIDLSAAAVEAFALSTGLVKSKKEMTEAIKVQARYGLLMQSTGKFAGDFADTSDGLANSSRVLGASMTDLSAKLGEQLTPSIATAVGYAIQLLDVIEAISGIPSTPLPGVSDESLQSWADFNELQQAAAAGNENAQEAFRNGGKELTALDAAVGSTSEATRRYEEDVSRLNDAELIRAATTKQAADSTEDAAKAAADAAAEHERLAESVRDAATAHQEMRDATVAAANSTLGYRNQVVDTSDAIYAANLIALDKASTDAQVAQSSRDAEAAAYDQAASAVQVASDYAEAQGATLSASEANEVYRAELQKLAPTMSGEARRAVEALIAQLRRAPGEMAGSTFDIGAALSEGIADGVEGSAYKIAEALRGAVEAGKISAKLAARIASPSRLFAEEVGAPISEGIAEGITEDADKITEALGKAIDDAADAAIARGQEAVEAAQGLFDGFWGGIEIGRSLDDMNERISDGETAVADAATRVAEAYAAINEAETPEDREKAQQDIVKATEAHDDAVQSLKDAYYAKTKATHDDILVDDQARDAWIRTAEQAGLTKQQIDGLIDSYLRLAQAKADAAKEADAVANEAAIADTTRKRFSDYANMGLITAEQLDALSKLSATAQLAQMRTLMTNADKFFGGRDGGGHVSAGGSYLVGANGPEMLHMGSTGGTISPNAGGMGGLDPVKWGQMAADAFSKRMQTNGRAS